MNHFPALSLNAILTTIGLLLSCQQTFAQPEVQAWGNLRGIRINGQLIRLETSLRVVGKDWTTERATARERNWTRYFRTGNVQTVITRMDSLFFTEKVSEKGNGTAVVEIEFDPHTDTILTGAFFHLLLPAANFGEGEINLIDPYGIEIDNQPHIPVGENEFLRARAKGISVNAPHRKLDIRGEAPIHIIVTRVPESGDIGIYFTLASGRIVSGETVHHEFQIKAEADADTRTAHLKLFPDFPGNEFLGLGGNFRLQNPRDDPQVIDYCLENLEVRMGRVELPWYFWHTSDSINPLEEARKGNIHPRAKAAMEMAQRLDKMGMPVLLAAWFPPPWAIEGEFSFRARNPDGSFGKPLNQSKAQEIYESLTSYMIYLKEAYGVETVMFSFNESDLGINVRQTAEEHAKLIRELGEFMRSQGLKTRLLLGDTADGNGFEFVNASLNDPETWQYIGAVSFHSWRGWTDQTLLEWFEAADRINVPLIIGEGSIDAAAWRYPGIFEESHYAMEEIKLYTRIMAICQPQSILQWQLTSDYSPLKGGGIFGNDSTPLKPTQRFYNLKQLSFTPQGLFSIPLTCDNEEMFVAALGDVEKGKYAFHLVNDGVGREVILSGLPKNCKHLQIFVTDDNRGMEKGEKIRTKNGQATFRVGPASYTTLISR